MRASDLFIQCLENEGVEYIFGIPGEENLDFLDSLKSSKIKLILTRHEQAAGFMAATYGRLTGKVGVALATLGPGATNFMTPAAYAQLGGMPVLFITGQKPIKTSKQGRFQIIDIVEMMKPVAKMSRQIVSGNTIPSLVRESFRVAQREKPGAVHLELPEDIAAEETSAKPFTIEEDVVSKGSQESIQKAIDRIHKAKHPLLLIASGANRSQLLRQSIDQFLKKTNMYFFSTQMGKGVIDERHPNYLGTSALSEHDYLHCAIERSDLILNVGHDVVEKPPFFMSQDGREVLHIAFYPAQIDDVYFPQHEVAGDIAKNMLQITEGLSCSEHWDFSYFDRVVKEIKGHIQDKSKDIGFPLIPQRVVSDVREAMPSDGFVSLDNGVYKIWFSRNYMAHEPNTLLLDNALATMGAGLASAMAAQIVYPSRASIAICGDGGFMMNSQELETAVRLKLNIVVLVLRDDAYGMIKWKQGGMGFKNFGLDFGNPDFVKYSESYGAKGCRVKKSGELAPMIKEAIKTGGVYVIDVPVNYSENERVLIEELKTKTCTL